MRKAAVILGVAGAAVGMLAVPANAEEPSGSATGIEGLLETPILDLQLPPIPLVTLPPGGDEEVLDLSVPPLAAADVLQATSEQTGPNSSQSSASVAGVSAIDDVLPVDGVLADVVSSACTASPSGNTAESAIVDGSALGVPLAVSPDPNTTISVPMIGSITLNEQTTNGTETTVNAVHVVVDTALGVGADIAIATSVCDSGIGSIPVSEGPGLETAPPATPTSGTPTLAG